MNKKKSGVIFSTVALILAMLLILSSCAPVSLTKIKTDSFTQTVSKNTGEKYHKAKRKDYEFVCKSGLIELYYHKGTGTVGILDTSANEFWSSIPLNTEKTSFAYAPLEIVLSNGSKEEYVLNSQDNCIAFGNFKSDVTRNGVTIKYSLSLDKDTGKADISELKSKEVRADVTVKYTLVDGSFYASISMNQIDLPKGVSLEKIRLLNSFGAYSDNSKDDFIFIPDGSGALVKTGIEDKKFSPVILSVYGSDPALSLDGNAALFGAFGMKHKKGAFLCIIESGETVANITANRISKDSINSVGAEFGITDISLKQGKSRQSKTLGYTFNGEIRLCYRFLSGKSATYSGMAAACRENLIRNSVISTKSVETVSNEFPLVVNLQFGKYGKNNKPEIKSTYAQAKDLMALLKAKGINSAILRANGIFESTSNSSNSFGKFIKKLGSKNEYNELYSYLKTQNFPLYIDTDILTYKKDISKGAKNILGKETTISKQQFLELSKLENGIDSLLYLSSPISFDGYALNDMGTYLYSDYSSDFFSRETSKIEIASQVSVLASYNSVMVDNGNFYSIKNADIISALPLGTVARDENKAYCSIPFTQLLLHGTYDYSTESINLSDDMNTAFLRSIEYGSLISADWYCANTSKDDKYSYNNNINDLVSYSVKANDILGDLRNARMTSHYEVKDGVYCTEYNNSSKVYVNYTDKNVKINGITVNAKDCVKVS